MKLNLNNLLILSLYGVVLVDLLTGALLLNNPDTAITPGIIYKLVILVLLYYFIPKLPFCVFLSNFLLISSTAIATAFGGMQGLASNLITITKLLMFVTVFYYILYASKKELLNTHTIYRINLFSFYVIVANQLLGLIGFGKPTYYLYGIPVGTSGFFFEHNAVSIALIMIVAVIYLHNRTRYSFKKMAVFLAFTIMIGFSLATKTAILGTFVIALLAILDLKKKLFPVVVLIAGIVIAVNWETIQEAGQIAKVINDIEVNQSEGLLSGRTLRLDKCIDDYFHKFSLGEQIVGIGNFRILNDVSLGETAETDYIDILKMSGLVGFLVVYLPFFWIVGRLAKRYYQSKDRVIGIIIILDFMFLVISSTAGHLFTSGSVCFYLAFLNAYPFVSDTLEIKPIHSRKNTQESF